MLCAVADVKKTVAKRIKMARLERDLKQSDLAEMLTVNQANIAKIESGRVSIGVETLARIAHALHKPIGYFFEEFEDVQSLPKAQAKRRKAA